MLAAAVIVALGALPTLTMASNRARFRVQALQLCQNYLEAQRSQAWPVVDRWPYQQTLPAQVMPGTGTEFQPSLELQKVTGYDPDQLRRAKVKVRWKERDRWQELEQETMISRVPRF